MAKIIISSDSTCDLSAELKERYGVKILPLGVTLGTNVYRDGFDITPDDIYAYHDKTGIAGYTMVYSSRGVSLRAHQPFTSLQDVVYNNRDIESKVNVFETMKNRMLVEDTDQGVEIRAMIDDLKLLIHAYTQGIIKQRNDL